MRTIEKKSKCTGFYIAQKLLTLSLLLLIIACSSSDDNPATMAALGNLTGTVLDATANAYQNVEVTLEKSGQIVETAFTDTNGTYQINQVEEGNYNLSITAPLGSEVTSANPSSITINDGTTTANFDISIKSKAAFYVVAPNDPFLEVRNASGGDPTGNDLLYTPISVSNPTGPNSPILAPDGHHVNLQEWRAAAGSATVSCDGGVTVYSLEFTNLIPDGVYTVWNAVMVRHLEPSDAVSFSSDISGLGALGDGSSNIMVASASGEASLDVSVPPGNLSMFGSLSPCAIANSPGLILILNYHIDGNTYGDTPGPDSQDVGHMLVYY